MGLRSWLNRPSRKALEQELAATRSKLQELELHRHWVQQVVREQGYTELIEPNHETFYLAYVPRLGYLIEQVDFQVDPDGAAQNPPHVEHINRLVITDHWGDTETWELQVVSDTPAYGWAKV